MSWRVASVMIVVMVGCRGPEKVIEAAPAYAALMEIEDGMAGLADGVKATVLEIAYVDLFVASSMRRGAAASDREIEVRFDAARLVAFYADTEWCAREVAAALAELERRQRATDAHDKKVVEIYVSARMFDEARALAARHPVAGLEAMPVVREAAGLRAGAPTELVVDGDARVLTRQAVRLDQPAQIVVIGHPNCHFTQNAADAIEADPVLRAAFRGHTMWLEPPMTQLALADAQAWNRARPDLPMSLAFRRAEWPMLDRWSMPTFYFFQRGKLIGEVRGWPAVGRRAELVANARAIGLL